MNRYNYDTLQIAYQKHVQDSAPFFDNTMALRNSIQQLVDVDDFDGEYAINLISFLNDVVIGAVDAIELSKEMYNDEFLSMNGNALSFIENDIDSVLISDTLEDIYTYSHSYNEWLYAKTDALNTILDDLSCYMAVERPKCKHEIGAFHDSIYRITDDLTTKMIKFAGEERTSDITAYFNSTREFIKYMNDCIDPTGAVTKEYNPADLMTEPWYIKHNSKTMEYYRKKDYSYFAKRNPLNMPQRMKIAIGEKLAAAMSENPPDEVGISRFITSLINQAIKDGNLHDLDKYFNEYASIMLSTFLGYGAIISFVDSDDVDGLLSKMTGAAVVYGIFNGLYNRADQIEEFLTHTSIILNSVEDMSFSFELQGDGTKGTYTIALKGIWKGSVRGQDDIDVIILDFKVGSFTHADMSSEALLDLANQLLSDADRRISDANIALMEQMIRDRLPDHPLIEEALKALDYARLISEINAAYKGKSAAEIKSIELTKKAHANYLRCSVVIVDGIQVFFPSIGTLNLLEALNSREGTTRYDVNDLNNIDKLEEMVQARTEMINMYTDKDTDGIGKCPNIDYSQERSVISASIERNIFEYGKPCG